jgi:DNA-binding response OmpR family regulator
MTEPSTSCALLVATCPDYRPFLKFHLEGLGLRVDEEELLSRAPRRIENNHYNIVIFCAAPSIIETASTCRSIRKLSDVPIIFLLERGDTVGEEMALDAGANDFVWTPINPRVLALRIEQQLNLVKVGKPHENHTVNWDRLTINSAQRIFCVDGTVIPLTPAEFRFMWLLMNSPRQIFSRDQILEAIGSFRGIGSDHIIDNHASRIRQKIRTAGGPDVIAVVRTVGFRLANHSSD